MAKKNPYIFTIGFNPKDPDHIQVANLLNEKFLCPCCNTADACVKVL